MTIFPSLCDGSSVSIKRLTQNLMLFTTLCCLSVRAQTRSVAITFDDAPLVEGGDATEVHSVNIAILDALDSHHAPATVFIAGVRADNTSQSRPMLEEWKRRGYVIGNHTFSHLSFNDYTVAQEEADILRNEGVIASLLPEGTRFFRFPFNKTGDTQQKHDAILAFLAQHHYRVAACTIDNRDYLFAEAYLKALAAHDEGGVARIRKAYVEYNATQIDFYAGIHRQVFHRDVPQVILLHASRLNADTLDQILGLFAARHYSFVSLATAQSDSAYATPDTYATRESMMWGYRWAHERGVSLTGPPPSLPPDWISHYGN